MAIHNLNRQHRPAYLARIGASAWEVVLKNKSMHYGFFEALGISFQIIDDVLNLKGFENKGKTKAEDITAGKITYPIAIAMSLMSKAEKSKLYSIIKSKRKSKRTQQSFPANNQVPDFSICEKYAKQKLEKHGKSRSID